MRTTDDPGRFPGPGHRCEARQLYRVHRRSGESALRVIGLYPYLCEVCGVRALMFGRFHARNWRWRRVRIRIIFRLVLPSW